MIFDLWSWSFYNPWQTSANWQYCYPLFLRCVPAAIASEPFDVGIGMCLFGVMIFGVGMFSLGFYIHSRSWPM